MMSASIERIEWIEFTHEKDDISENPEGSGVIYDPGNSLDQSVNAIRVHTDIGITGEWVGASPTPFSQFESIGSYLIGKDPFKREKFQNELRKRLFHTDMTGIGPIDIALWDFAGKYSDSPIHELLGSFREELPTYASSHFADDNGGLDSPEAYADFAEECRDMGYQGFKIHGWNDNVIGIQREIDIVHAVGERTGDDLALMIDPVSIPETWGQAVELGKALDEQGFFWYEDPYADGGFSHHGHEKLAEHVETPLCVSGEARQLEQKADFIASGATDFARASPGLDRGITSAIKAAHVAQGLGVDIEFHQTNPATRHLMAAVRNTNFYELGLVHPDVEDSLFDYPEVYENGYSDKLDAINDDGCVPVPSGPGLGVEYDWSFIEDNANEKRVCE